MTKENKNPNRYLDLILSANVPKRMFQLFSIIVLLGVSTCLAFKQLSVEMGLSIVAGALGLTFSNLDKFSEFKGGGFSAKLKEQIEAVVEKQTEENVQDNETEVPYQETKIIKALTHPDYTWRSVRGLMNDTGIEIKQIGKPINDLMDLGLIRYSFGKGGAIYALTSEGRSYAKNQGLKYA